MVKYIENINVYLTHMKIKQTYVSLKSGINTSTLSRILNGSRDVNISEMEKIAKALGKKVDYFLDEKFELPVIPNPSAPNVVFYAGEPDKEQERFAMQLIELLDNAEEVLGAEARFMMKIGE